MRVLTILARYGANEYPHAEDEIQRLFERQMPNVARTVIVVDNALPAAIIEARGNRAVIGGDNSVFEFSAFDRGLAHAADSIWSYDLIHFATSAFNTLYVAYLERFDEPLLAAVARRPVLVGHIDCYNEPVELLTFRSQHWIRSCFFFMPPAEAMTLGSFVSMRDRARLFTGRADAPFRADAPLSFAYRRLITDWLTGADIGQGVQWHSSFAVSDATIATFERKALCIINEHLLAIRTRAMGCRVVDATWLSSRLGGREGQAVEWNTSWREQLAGRDRDAIVVERPAPLERSG
jgi:hypothetical protein